MNSLSSADFWLRLLYTVLFALAWQIAEVFLLVIAVVQIGYRIFTGNANPGLAGYGSAFSLYAAQIGRYVTGAADQKPWPFMEWPATDTFSSTAAPEREAQP